MVAMHDELIIGKQQLQFILGTNPAGKDEGKTQNTYYFLFLGLTSNRIQGTVCYLEFGTNAQWRIRKL
jgi:hypothetical protein